MNKPRAILPDAVSEDRVIIIKACSRLMPTYEIRMLAYMANTTGRKAMISVIPSCQIDPRVEAFVEEHGIEIHRSS